MVEDCKDSRWRRKIGFFFNNMYRLLGVLCTQKKEIVVLMVSARKDHWRRRKEWLLGYNLYPFPRRLQYPKRTLWADVASL